MEQATASYLHTVLRFRPDEKAFLDSSLMGVGALDADDITDDAESDLEYGP
jgi:hypothetical protein